MRINFPKKLAKNCSTQTAIVGISVGQAYHNSEEFNAVTGAVKARGFGQRILMIADSLQAHNLLWKDPSFKNKDLSEARKKARESGDEFLKNPEIVSAVKTYTRVIRWDEFLGDPHYEEAKKTIDDINDPEFVAAVNNVIHTFIRTKQSSNSTDDLGKFFTTATEHCKNYVKEELAVMLLWATHPEEYPFHWLVYPKPKHGAAQYIYDHFVRAAHPGLLRDLTYTKEAPQKKKELSNDSVADLITQRGGGDSPISSGRNFEDTDDEITAVELELLNFQKKVWELKTEYKKAKKDFKKKIITKDELEKVRARLMDLLKQSSERFSDSSSSSDEAGSPPNSGITYRPQ